MTAPEFVDDAFRSVLFATERLAQSALTYRIPVPRGDYEVTLLFAEGCCSRGCEDIEDPASSSGDCRVVDVILNGVLVEDQFSQHVEAHRALQEIERGSSLPNADYGIALARSYQLCDVDEIEVAVQDLGGGNPPGDASIRGISIREEMVCVGETAFKRGDTNVDGALNVTDGVFVLTYLFGGGEEFFCGKAADVNDTGRVDLTDPVYLLNFLFAGGPAPAAPFAECAPDPTPDDLTCERFPSCM